MLYRDKKDKMFVILNIIANIVHNNEQLQQNGN